MKAIKMAEVAVNEYASEFNNAWISGMRFKLGLFEEEEDDFKLSPKPFGMDGIFKS